MASMTSRTRSFVQDNGLNFPFNGKNVEAAKKQRRPLQELSSKNLENLDSTKLPNIAAIKTAQTFACEKPKQEKVKKNGGRRALGDLTNSSKVLPKDSSKVNSLKIFSAANNGEVLPGPTQEGCLHNHADCVKAQRSMDKCYFLETVGFRKADCSTPIVTSKLPPLSTASKIESTRKQLSDLDEIGMLEFGCKSPMPMLDSSIRRVSVEDLDVVEFGEDWDSFNFSGFKVKESPSR